MDAIFPPLPLAAIPQAEQMLAGIQVQERVIREAQELLDAYRDGLLDSLRAQGSLVAVRSRGPRDLVAWLNREGTALYIHPYASAVRSGLVEPVYEAFNQSVEEGLAGMLARPIRPADAALDVE